MRNRPDQDAGLAGFSNALFRTEYSPETQLEVLHVATDELLEPVLDLGCGHNGHLVRWLRARDIAAVGIDHAADSAPGIVAGDWFEFDFGRAAWGSIVSHMAFSSFFLHSHLRDTETARRCGRLYMALLAALKPEGRFYYAPGLPFMEDLLPRSQFEVVRHPIEDITGNWADQDLTRLFGRSVLYAASIRKATQRDSK